MCTQLERFLRTKKNKKKNKWYKFKKSLANENFYVKLNLHRFPTNPFRTPLVLDSFVKNFFFSFTTPLWYFFPAFRQPIQTINSDGIK